jgi:hypothetical protein
MTNLRDLVRILTRELDVPVTHWEITNEWDNTYEKAGKLDELWPLVAKMADEVRSASPDAQVGGPALTWPKPSWLIGLYAAAGGSIDFVSYHGYAGGKPTTPNDAVMARAARMGEHALEVEQLAANAGLENLPSYKTEFNVQWTWQPYERRHANSVGAAFLASTIDELARGGTEGAAVWHAMGNAYGLVDDDQRRRASGQLYLWANRYAHGDVAAFSFADSATTPTTRPAEHEANPGLAVVPVLLPDGGRTLLLANQTDHPLRLPAAAHDLLGLASADGVRILSITADGGNVADASADLVELPGYSVTFLTDAAGGETFGTIDLPGMHAEHNF